MLSRATVNPVDHRPRGQADPPYHRVDARHDRGSSASPLAPAQHATLRRDPRPSRLERASALLSRGTGGGAGEERKGAEQGALKRGQRLTGTNEQRSQLKWAH